MVSGHGSTYHRICNAVLCMDYFSGLMEKVNISSFSNVILYAYVCGCCMQCRGLQGSGLPWKLVPAPAGSLLSQGLWGFCRGFPGCVGEKALPEACAVPRTYVYRRI